MWIVWLGSVASGMMWGWLAANRAVGRRRRSFLDALALILATLLLSAAIAWRVEKLAVLPFLVSASIAFLVHLEWMHSLHIRVNS
jgi:hypothetical protein